MKHLVTFKANFVTADSHNYSFIGKMTVFDVIFEVDSSIGKLCNLLGHFNEKDKVDF